MKIINALHTPGPWNIVCSSVHSNPETTRKDILGHSQFGPAFVAGDISEIDAHLISAAPDLLSALQWFADELPGIIRQYCPEGVPVKVGEAHEAALNAITKAKGEA